MTPGIDQLTAAGVSKELAEQWLIHVQKALARYSINTPRQVAAWIAQTAHESGGFRTLTENLNYSADTMAVVWPARFAEREPDQSGRASCDPKRTPRASRSPTNSP